MLHVLRENVLIGRTLKIESVYFYPGRLELWLKWRSDWLSDNHWVNANLNKSACEFLSTRRRKNEGSFNPSLRSFEEQQLPYRSLCFTHLAAT
jgi:hypothetical protein